MLAKAIAHSVTKFALLHNAYQDISEKDSKVVNFCYRVKHLYEQWKTI